MIVGEGQLPVTAADVRPCAPSERQHRRGELAVAFGGNADLARDMGDQDVVIGGVAEPRHRFQGDSRHLGRRDLRRLAELQPPGPEDLGGLVQLAPPPPEPVRVLATHRPHGQAVPGAAIHMPGKARLGLVRRGPVVGEIGCIAPNVTRHHLQRARLSGAGAGLDHQMLAAAHGVNDRELFARRFHVHGSRCPPYVLRRDDAPAYSKL